MEALVHQLSELFRQLGLPDEALAIEQFIASHCLLDGTIRLADAAFWNAAQAQFLHEEIADDADWAELVDTLDNRLRA